MADSKKIKNLSQEEEIAVFIPEKTKISTIHNEEVIVPKISWKKEIKLIRIIEEVLSNIGELANDADTVATVGKILEVAPDKATQFVSVVLEKEAQWVENNLDLPVIVSLIVPLLRQRLEMVMEKMRPYIPEGAEDSNLLDALKVTPTSETIQ